MKKEYDLKKLRKRKVSRVADPSQSKVLTSIRFDWDVMKWATEQAEKTGLPYQTFINMKLRELMVAPKNQPMQDEIREAILRDLQSGERLKALVELLVKESLKKGHSAA